MEKYEIFPLRERSEFIKRAAGWFSSKWNIPEREYAESMIKSLRGAAVPQWYLATAGERIVGGSGVIENDFHNRKDLAPNVCALFVEEPFRGRGVARELLSFLCADMAQKGVNTLYLLTEHTFLRALRLGIFLHRPAGRGKRAAPRVYAQANEIKKVPLFFGSGTFFGSEIFRNFYRCKRTRPAPPRRRPPPPW